jgi:hypothetical protein
MAKGKFLMGNAEISDGHLLPFPIHDCFRSRLAAEVKPKEFAVSAAGAVEAIFSARRSGAELQGVNRRRFCATRGCWSMSAFSSAPQASVTERQKLPWIAKMKRGCSDGLKGDIVGALAERS